MNQFRSKLVRFHSGERFPVLLDPSGMPMFLPNYYLVSMSRGQNDATNTIIQKMNSIKTLYTWASSLDVDLENRFKCGELLRIEEIESLVHALKLKYKVLVADNSSENQSVDRNSKVLSFEKFRMNANQSEKRYVKHQTQITRLRYITAYLKWFTTISMSRVSRDSGLYQRTMAAMQEMISLLEARQAHGHRPTQSRLLAPKGFSKDVQNRIIDVIQPDHPENPWTLPFSKVRNQVYLLMAIGTGLRIGESLCIKLHDLDFSNQNFRIVRRPNDPDDTRKIKPEVKTRERYLPIGKGWLHLLRAYVRQRALLIKTKSSKEVRRNPYLFVSKYGTPLTLRAAGDIFIDLRNSVSNLPGELTQHKVRKAWNTRLSEYLEEIDDIGLEYKDFIRKYLMGWSRNSKMPELYNLDYVIKQAGILSLDIQHKAIMR